MRGGAGGKKCRRTTRTCADAPGANTRRPDAGGDCEAVSESEFVGEIRASFFVGETNVRQWANQSASWLGQTRASREVNVCVVKGFSHFISQLGLQRPRQWR